MKVLAVIPAYNEAKFISNVIQQAQNHVPVCVIDNNSSDNTAKVAENCKARVHVQKIQGQGAAVRLAWQGVVWDNYYEAIITLDSDGQHDPNDIPNLLSVDADAVLGSRFLNGFTGPRYRKLGIDIITWLYNVGHRQKITDSQCCFRLYKKQVIQSIEITENGFAWSTEVLIKIRKAGFTIAEAPVKCIYHDDFKANSTLNPIKHGLSVALKTVWWRLKLWN